MLKEKIKAHYEKHKFIYGVGTGIVLAGITVIIMRERHATLLSGADGSEMTTMRSFFFSLYARESGNNIVTTVHSGNRGHPGFRVKHLRSGIEFDTQGAAARAFHIPESILSSHLNGKFNDACGEIFERIPA